MFTEKSRYYAALRYQARDRRGRIVPVVAVPEAPRQNTLGFHARKQGQRPDHLAYKYLNDAAGFWRLAELNDAMLPEALTELDEIAIPVKNR